ncbi:MAG TPA: tetratricopeptide repeat protein [Rhizomicrobium sp.]|jgi:tetratricopeptide (TPR) repeat protein
MSLKSCLSITAGVVMLIAAAPAFAVTSWPSASLLASGTADACAAASAGTQEGGQTTDAALANCTMAVKLAISDSARAEVLNNRSVLLYARGEYGAALADNTAALKINDRMAEAIVNRGSIFLVQHRPQAAAANFDRALSFNPAHPEKVYFNRALAREDMGDLNGAYADYAQASKLAPQWEQPKREMTRFTIVRQKPIS